MSLSTAEEMRILENSKRWEQGRESIHQTIHALILHMETKMLKTGTLNYQFNNCILLYLFSDSSLSYASYLLISKLRDLGYTVNYADGNIPLNIRVKKE